MDVLQIIISERTLSLRRCLRTFLLALTRHTSLQITFSRTTNLFSLCQAVIRIKMKFTFHRKTLKTRATTNNFERNFHFLCVEFQFRDRFLHNKRFAFEN